MYATKQVVYSCYKFVFYRRTLGAPTNSTRYEPHNPELMSIHGEISLLLVTDLYRSCNPMVAFDSNAVPWLWMPIDTCITR